MRLRWLKPAIVLLATTTAAVTGNADSPYPAPGTAREKIEAMDHRFDAATFLHSVDFDRLYLASLFLDAGMTLQAADARFGNTALHMAATGGRIEMLRLLIDRGANVDAVNDDQNTPLHVAINNASSELVRALLQAGARTSIANVRGNQPLHLAVMRRRAEAVIALLDTGADLEARDGNGHTPLMTAARRNAFDMLALLLERGASIEAQSTGTADRGQNAVLLATTRGHLASLTSLLDAGAKPDVADASGRTALHSAVRRQNGELTRILMRAGVDEVRVDNSGHSALSVAVNLRHPGIVTALLDDDTFERAAFEHAFAIMRTATSQGSATLLHKLIAAGAPVNEPQGTQHPLLKVAIDGRRPQILELLLVAGAHVDGVLSREGHTPLTYAVAAGSLDLVSIVLDHNANIEARTQSGESPLAGAVSDARSDIVALLLARGADANQSVGEGFNALGLAIARGDIRSVEALIGAGADLSAKSTGDLTPLQQAERAELDVIGELLRQATAKRATGG